MPRSTKSRRVQADAEWRADEIEAGNPVGEPVVDAPAEWIAEQDADDLAEVTETPTAALNPDVPVEVLAANGNTDVDGERIVPVGIAAPYAHQFDWDTLVWTPTKQSGSRPCMCNRLVGGECELTTKSRFAIGHDARFKGKLQTAFREGRKLRFDFDVEDRAVVLDADNNPCALVGTVELEPDVIARLVAPKLLPYVTHVSRNARLQKLDAAAGTTVPQTADRPDELITDADLAEIVDDAPDADVEDVRLPELEEPPA